MNIALEKTEEFVDGVKRRAYGDAFIRGNNGMYQEFDQCYADSSIVMYIAAED